MCWPQYFQTVAYGAVHLAIPVVSATAAVVVVVVVELPQTPVDDPQKRQSCSWKTDELITIGALVLS